MTIHTRPARARPMGSRPAAATRERILRAAARLVCEHGDCTWPVALVAERAGVAKGSIYTWFDSRDALMRALLVQEIERWVIQATGQAGDRQDRDTFGAMLWRTARDRPVLTALAGRVALGHMPLPTAALGHLATHLSVQFSLRQADANRAAGGLVAALLGALACGPRAEEHFRVLARGVLDLS